MCCALYDKNLIWFDCSKPVLYYFWFNAKEDILKNASDQTAAIDFHRINDDKTYIFAWIIPLNCYEDKVI